MPPTTFSEYLVSHGKRGDCGRFVPAAPLLVQRGQRVVVQSRRGLELGVVLCPIAPPHLCLLAHLVGGCLLRQASAADERRMHEAQRQGHAVLAAAQHFVAGHDLPVTILDLEVFLDGRQGVLQYLGPPESDLAPLGQALAHEFALALHLENLASPAAAGPPLPGSGCGGGSPCATGCGWRVPEAAAGFAPGVSEGIVGGRWSLL